MSSTNVIVNINSIEDIGKISDDTKYINLSIDKVDTKVIDYFLLHGQNYMYADLIGDRCGFIYVSYDTFKRSEKCIDDIIDMMPSHITDIEKVRYIYIKLGKMMSLDINTIDTKNDTLSFAMISTINNIWGSLDVRRCSSTSTSKIFMYLCSRIGIKSELVSSSIKGNVANKISIQDNYIIADLFNDISYIQGNFITHYFDNYNSDEVIDKKIGYITSHYSDYYIDKALGKINYTDIEAPYKILSLTEKIINISMIGSYELGSIYRYIFDKYCPNYDIRINNFYVFDGNKEHFIVISYDDNYYFYNYTKKAFTRVSYNDIYSNFENKKIGLYNGEDFSFNKEGVVMK